MKPMLKACDTCKNGKDDQIWLCISGDILSSNETTISFTLMRD